ncbi:MAG: carboxypeptidase-like regulatory domain-containing protein [Verrucomicrobia bacterium]|nr:carboxypeptidase-like regulatory domain-containing protein [Verrucomicrobiota bacterium]
MRKYSIAIGTIILAVIVLLYWVDRLPMKDPASPGVPGQTSQGKDIDLAATSANSEGAIIDNTNGLPSIFRQPNLATTDEEMEAMAAQEIERRKQDIARGMDEWRTPIEFYGKVVDENDQPVERAQILFGTTDLSHSGTSDYPAESDARGSFTISDIQGKLLTVKVSKEGYYASKQNIDSFYYAGQDQNFVPDAANPVIFRLRKKGEAEPLIHIPQFGLRTMRDFLLTADGIPVEISLTDGKTRPEGQGDIRVEYWAEPPQPGSRKFSWKCRISVPGGGLQPITEEFPFQAPDTGYIGAEEHEADPESGGWNDQIEKNVFVKLRDGRYARIRFLVLAVAKQPFFRMESYLNPSGSRNLEYDPNLRLSPGSPGF